MTTTTTATKITEAAASLLPGVGVDVGTANICVCRRTVDGNFSVQHHRNMLFEMDASDEAVDLLERSKYLYLHTDNHYYIVGEDALRLVNALGRGEILRPMANGLLNPNLKKAQALMNHILATIVGPPITPNEPLRFSVPANPVDRPEMNNLFHQMVLTEFFRRLGYSPKPINEALANLYKEAPSMTVEGESEYPLTGLSLSCGAGMANACLAVNGLPTVEFSITKSGDHIDQQVAAATGERLTRIIRVKEKELDLGQEPANEMLQALSIYYDEFIKRILTKMGQEFTARKVSLDGAIDIVVCGGTAMARNFIGRAQKVVAGLDLPFKIRAVRLSDDPFYSVAEGACLAALSDHDKKET